MYILKIAKAIKKKDVNQWNQRLYLWKPLWQNWIFQRKQLLFNETLEKKRFIASRKQINIKILDPLDAKGYYQSFREKKNRKSVKQSEISTCQPKTFDTINIK